MYSHLRKPNFDRIRVALFGGQPDFVPLIELGIHPSIKERILGRPVSTLADDAEFMASMGYDFIKLQPVLPMDISSSQATSLSGGIDRSWAPEHGGLILSMADFEKYAWPKTSDISYRFLEEAKEGLPEGMGVIGQYGDIFTMAWEMMGFENFALASYENPDLVNALMGKIGGLVYSMYESMAQMEWVGALWYSDDIAYSTGLLMNPDFFRKALFPWVKKIGDLAKARNIPFLYHSDGILYPVMEDLIACGVTSLHPIEPKAMDIVEVKAKYGDRLSLCGNIDVDLLARGTPAEVEEQVIQRIKALAPGGGYCLCSSNSIPDYIILDNYIQMVKTALEWGKY
jgi:uroporphyrinogen decarboxylase